MTAAEQAASSSRHGILVYGMYDLTGLDRAPKVRIEMMTRALSGRIRTEQIVGGRFRRALAALRWLLGGGPRRVGAVYVESITTSSMPTDLAFLLLMRLLGKPVGVYFRDAYQLYRDTYPRQSRRQALSDWAWRITKPILARIATVAFVQSDGLGVALHLRHPVLLPPGTDPSSPNLGYGDELLVAYVGGAAWADGFGTLVDAMAIVRSRCPEARLVAVGAGPAREVTATLPDYVELRKTGRDGLAAVLKDARCCVIPRPITEYTNFVVPIKLWDYLSYGKPVVATEAIETARVIHAGNSGLTTPATPEGLAEGMLELLLDKGLARQLATNARAFACMPSSTWDARAVTVVESLGLA